MSLPFIDIQDNFLLAKYDEVLAVIAHIPSQVESIKFYVTHLPIWITLLDGLMLDNVRWGAIATTLFSRVDSRLNLVEVELEPYVMPNDWKQDVMSVLTNAFALKLPSTYSEYLLTFCGSSP